MFSRKKSGDKKQDKSDSQLDNKPADKKAAKKDKAASSPKGVVHLGRLSTRVSLAACLILIIATVASHQLMTQRADEALATQATVTSEALAGQVAAHISQYARTLTVLATDPQVAAALVSADAAQLTSVETRLAEYFPGALALRLIKAGLSEPVESVTPPISFACLVLLSQAEKQQTVTPAEVHLPGGKHQHVELVQRVMHKTPQGMELAGNLMLSLPVAMIRTVLTSTALKGAYVELQQHADQRNLITLVTTGDASQKSSSPDYVAKVAGTRWQLAYWTAPLGVGLIHPNQLVFWAIVAVAVFLLVMVMVSLNRTLAGVIKNDLASVINLVRDMASGQVKKQYPIRLHNFRGAIEVLLRMAHEFRGAARMTPAPAPAQTVESGSGPALQQELAPDPMYQDKSAIQVEEVDDATEGRVPRNIFKAYDIRGIVGQTLTPAIAADIGRAIGSEAYERGQQSVIVARDGRLSGPELIANLIKGLRETGRDVIDIGMVPTPVLYFATQYLNTGSGVMLTGSHNPPDYNGFKIVLRNETLSGDTIQALRQRIEAENFLVGEGNLETVDVMSDYIERITSDIKLARPMKVVLDCGNGVGGEAAPRLLRTLGCDVIEMYCDIDGNFPNHHPDPSQPENLEELIARVKQEQADIGLALDGDGDRLGVIDSDGNVIWPDRQMMIYSMDILSRNKGATIIYDVKCSGQLGNVIQQYGGVPLMWRTGHSLIKAKMIETGALLAGEMSGHIFFKERWFGFDDALYTAARLLEVLAADKRPSAKIFGALPNMLCTPELRIDLAEGQQFVFMKKLLAQAELPGAVLNTIDGLRADFEDGWGLVRASNTTPCLVLRFEANSPQSLKRVQSEFRRILTEVDSSLKMPF